MLERRKPTSIKERKTHDKRANTEDEIYEDPPYLGQQPDVPYACAHNYPGRWIDGIRSMAGLSQGLFHRHKGKPQYMLLQEEKTVGIQVSIMLQCLSNR